MPPRALAATLRVLDGLAFASLIPAGVAAALLLAASACLGVPADGVAAGLAAAGTLFVYGVDRLRDTALDQHRQPERTRFVEAHRPQLWLLTAAAGVAAAGFAAASTREVQWLCAGVLAAGLLHRRLKRFALAKPVYVAAAWVAVTAGIPALAAPEPDRIPWLLGIYATAIGANLLGSNALPTAACLLAAAGAAVALAGPSATLPLAAIPAAECLALCRRHEGERYTLIVLDGALLLGAAVALLATRAT